MKWTNNTLVEKLPQFLNSVIHRFKKKQQKRQTKKQREYYQKLTL